MNPHNLLDIDGEININAGIKQDNIVNLPIIIRDCEYFIYCNIAWKPQ